MPTHSDWTEQTSVLIYCWEKTDFKIYIFLMREFQYYILDWQETICFCEVGSAYDTLIVFMDTFSSVTQSCSTLCDPMDCSTPGFPILHQLLELTQTHVHWVGDAIQPSHPLSFPSPPAFTLSKNQGLFKWVCSSHHVAKVLEIQFQQQSFQWLFRADFL